MNDFEKDIRVLLVEDDIESGTALAAALESRAMEVVVCETKDEGFEKFVSESFDIVVSDIRLAGASGVDLLKDIRERDSEFPVILLTAYSDIEAAVNAVKLGAQDFIRKPLDDIDVLSFPIKKAVTLYRAVNDNRRLEKQMLEYIDKLRVMGSEMTLAEERERRKLAEGLHDSVGQLLTGSLMQLDYVAEALEGDASKDLNDARDAVSEALESTRSLSFQLCPPTLYTAGIVRVLGSFVKNARKVFKIDVKYEFSDETIELSEDNKVIVYRTVRELVLNAVKHAAPSEIVVSIRASDDACFVAVKDNGSGFKENAEYFGDDGPSGIGLFSVEERLKVVGGTLDVASAPGEGTEVVVSVPLKSDI